MTGLNEITFNSDDKKINIWKILTIILLIISILMVLQSIFGYSECSKQQVETPVGKIDNQTYQYIQDTLLTKYKYVYLKNLETGEVVFLTGEEK